MPWLMRSYLQDAVEAQVGHGDEEVDAWWCTVAAELAMRNQKQTAESLRHLCLGTHPAHLVPDHVEANHILVRTLADPVLVERMRCDERTVDVLLCELKAMAEAGLLHMSLAVVEVAIGCMYAHVPSRTRRRPQWWS